MTCLLIGIGWYPSCHPLGSLPRFIFYLKFPNSQHRVFNVFSHRLHCSGSFPVALLLTTLTTLLLSFLVIQLPNVAYFFGVRPPSSTTKDSSTLPGRRLRGMATGWHKLPFFLIFSRWSAKIFLWRSQWFLTKSSGHFKIEEFHDKSQSSAIFLATFICI